LDREESGDATWRGGLREKIEFRFRRKARFENSRAVGPQDASDQLRQPMITLGADDEIDARRARHYFRALGLRYATSHGHDHATTAFGLCRFQTTNRPKLRIHLFGRLFPNVAGVEDHEIRIPWCASRNKAQRRHKLGHARRIIDIHLAAISLDVHALGQVRCRRRNDFGWCHPAAP